MKKLLSFARSAWGYHPVLLRPSVLISVGVAILLTLAFVFAGAAWWSEPRAGSPIVIVIDEGTSRRAVARMLADADMVSRTGYTFYTLFDVNARHPKAGEYELRRGMSYRTIAALLVNGPVRKEATVRTWEGETLDQNAARLLDTEGVATSTFHAIVGASRNVVPFDRSLEQAYPFLKGIPKGMSLEGYLFPDTYRVWDDSLPQDLVYKQLDALQKKVIEPYADAQKESGRTWHEILTLASIVQDEMHGAERQKIVAGVFFNRLEYGMHLQSDATINYLTGSGRARSTFTDLAIDSPYNTYKYGGIPPGPIGNPGLSAILAVLSPADTAYFYFLNDAQGNVYWARTGAEHNANRARAFTE